LQEPNKYVRVQRCPHLSFRSLTKQVCKVLDKACFVFFEQKLHELCLGVIAFILQLALAQMNLIRFLIDEAQATTHLAGLGLGLGGGVEGGGSGLLVRVALA
jgi:hypothetical protein